MKKRCLKSFYFVALLLCTSAASAVPIWQNGDLTTYGQGDWGSDATADALLTSNYDSIYASTFDVVEVGIPGTAGFSARFTGSSPVTHYLPATGPNGALDADALDPTSTSSGAFGGAVLALRLNIDFSDAGVMPANSSTSFGDLVLTNYSALPSLNGLTVRDISGLANTLLGGGSNGYTISDIDPVVTELNLSFGGGLATTFAQGYLAPPTTGVPEPSTLALLVIGLLGLISIPRIKSM